MDRLAVITGHLCPQSAPPQQEEERRDDSAVLHLSHTASQLMLGGSNPTTSTITPSIFRQAQPATSFPPSVSDYFGLEDLLSPEQKALRRRVREFMEKEVAPVAPGLWEKAAFPHELIPRFATLNLAGTTIKGYGCPGLSMLGAGVAVAEMARVDASCATFMLVHSCLGMMTIALCGSEEQKQSELPQLAKLKKVACWGLTEPDFGSDASSLATTARKVSGGWVLNGCKRWIGNSTFADVIIIFARNTSTNQVNGFIVRRCAQGFTAVKQENKIGLRIVQNGDITLDNVFVGEGDRLPGVNSFQDTNKVLAVSRVMVAWLPVGICMGVYDMAHRYLLERQQFGSPLASFQLPQEKLVRMLGNVQAMGLVAWRLSGLYEAGTMTAGQASMAKAWISLRARETVALGRELLGGNGILAEFLVAKAFCDLEPIYTYEGTYDVNALVTGREVTGIASFKAPVGRKASKGERAGKGML